MALKNNHKSRMAGAGVALLLATSLAGAVVQPASAEPQKTAATAAVRPKAPQPAGPQKFSGEYTVTFLGLTVARSNFSSTIDGDSYSVVGDVRSAGIGKLMDSVSGESKASGAFAGQTTQSRKFWTEYKNGKKNQMTSIAFSGGAVSNTVNEPALKKRDDKVPLKPEHLRGVADPISATLIKASGADDVCNRTLRIYDGELRADVTLSGARIGKIPGYEGEGVTCSAKFMPVAGYRTGNYAMKYMRNKAKISISFAELGDTGVYAPVRATVSTTLGTVTLLGRRVQG